jgi:hypothetical protein
LDDAMNNSDLQRGDQVRLEDLGTRPVVVQEIAEDGSIKEKPPTAANGQRNPPCLSEKWLTPRLKVWLGSGYCRSCRPRMKIRA